jgi:hypothetical protein
VGEKPETKVKVKGDQGKGETSYTNDSVRTQTVNIIITFSSNSTYFSLPQLNTGVCSSSAANLSVGDYRISGNKGSWQTGEQSHMLSRDTDHLGTEHIQRHLH